MTSSSFFSSEDRSYFSMLYFYSIIIMLYENHSYFIMNLTNQPSSQRKSSSRLSAIKSTQNLQDPRRLSTTRRPLESKYESSQKYLLGWGNVPFRSQQQNHIQIINKDITDFSCGEDHIVFTTSKGETFGIGKNLYGELSHVKCQQKEVILQIFTGFKIKKLFCTPFTTFFLTHSNDLYGCGLNNRGQLGLPFQQKITNPVKILKLCEFKQENGLKRKSSRSKLTSIYQQQLRGSILDHDSIEVKGLSLLQNGQYVVDIKGGPFHTLALTSKNRLFYSGNLYKSQSIQDDQCSFEFIQLNTNKIGKVKTIRSSLTGFCFMTQEKKLYLLGLINQKIYEEPHRLETIEVVSFDLNEFGLYVIDVLGNLTTYSADSLRGQKCSVNERLQQVICGVDYAITTSTSGNLYGIGSNSHHQLSRSPAPHFVSLTLLDYQISPNESVNMICRPNFVLSLMDQTPISRKNNQNVQLQQVQRENKILKELLSGKVKKSTKVQTQKQSRFQLIAPNNARTFDNSMQIPFNELTLGKQISQGGYGVIYKAIWRKTTVAVKIFKIQEDNTNAIKDFISQCHAMEALRHPNIVMFLGACTKPPHFSIVLQFCESGTLWSLLQKSSVQLSWDQRKSLALDTAKAMNYLHLRPTPVLHRDLKSLNLLLDANRKIKLADFGWTKGLQNYMTGKIGTYQWMAPQVISGCQYTEKADIFSFGIILWEIASREAPYRNIPGPQVAQDVLNKDLRPIIPKKTPEKFSLLIKRCWDKEPANRPSFSQIIENLQEMKFN